MTLIKIDKYTFFGFLFSLGIIGVASICGVAAVYAFRYIPAIFLLAAICIIAITIASFSMAATLRPSQKVSDYKRKHD